MCLTLWDQRVREGGTICNRRPRDPSEEHACQNIHMPQPAAQTPKQGHGQINQRLGYTTPVHDLGRENEQSYRQKREYIQLAKDLLRQDSKLAGVVQQ